MNFLAHICIGFFILSLFIPNAQQYLIPIAIFSVVLDIDHIPGMIKELFMSKRERKKLIKRPRFHSMLVRSDVQEPIGVITIMAILLALYLLGIKHILVLIAIFSILIHWVVDFLTVNTAPFAPVRDKKIVRGLLDPDERMEHKLVTRIVVTTIAVGLFLIAYFLF